MNGTRAAGDGMRVRAFLADSLALWGVTGSVEAGIPPVVAVIRVNETTVHIEHPASNDLPWRWFVRWNSAEMREERSRPCASLIGMLNTVRSALGVERGSAVRIAASPSSEDPLPGVSGGGLGRGQP